MAGTNAAAPFGSDGYGTPFQNAAQAQAYQQASAARDQQLGLASQMNAGSSASSGYIPSWQEMGDMLAAYGKGGQGYMDPRYQNLLAKFGGNQNVMNQWMNRYSYNPQSFQGWQAANQGGYSFGGATPTTAAPLNNPTPTTPPPNTNPPPQNGAPPPNNNQQPPVGTGPGFVPKPVTQPPTATTNGMIRPNSGFNPPNLGATPPGTTMSAGGNPGFIETQQGQGSQYNFNQRPGVTYRYRTNPAYFQR